jgi:membrane associated rhomboid family serine protease
MIEFSCGACGVSLLVPDDKAGRRGKCPKCGGAMIVPAGPHGPADASVPGAASGAAPQAEAGPAAEVCPICGIENTLNLKNCSGCGRLMRGRREPSPPPAAPARKRPGLAAGMDARCPSCSRSLAPGTKICVECGVYLPSGRPVLMKRDIDPEVLQDRANAVVKPISWVVRFGIYPITSEAAGRAKPYVTWTLAVLTVLISVWFWVVDAEDNAPPWARDLMLWPNEEKPQLVDYETFRELMLEEDPTLAEEDLRYVHSHYDRVLASVGTFGRHQLVTHAFLHGDVFHLVGNLIFLVVFGRVVNAALGNIGMVVVYLLLAALAAWIHMASLPEGSIAPMVGASGALMGLAGMCAVLFPLHRVYMVTWFRWGISTGVKVFPVWGVLVVCFYIAFDVVYTLFQVEDNVAHWAHLGGFMAGVGVALLLLAARAVYTGGDALSLSLGRHAWALIGRPAGRVRSKGFWGLW